MADTIVVAAGITETVECGPRRYTIRPLTYGEAAQIAQAEAAEFTGGDAMLAEVIRRAIEAADLPPDTRARYVDAITAHEEAQDATASIAMARPLDHEPDEAVKEWRGEWQRAQKAAQAAYRARCIAEAAVAKVAAVVAAREAVTRGEVIRRRDLVRATLLGWAGEGLPAFPEALTDAVIDALPASDVLAIAARAEALRRPVPTVGKG